MFLTGLLAARLLSALFICQICGKEDILIGIADA